MNESIRLLSTKDGSDKEYRVQLEAKAEGFIVTGFNGRRGGPLKAQQKIASPVPYEEAKKTYDDFVKSKIKGGYKPADAGAAYVVPADIGTPTGIKLHLLTQVPEADVERYITDDRYLAQEKFDGERRPVARREAVIGSMATRYHAGAGVTGVNFSPTPSANAVRPWINTGTSAPSASPIFCNASVPKPVRHR